MHFLWFVLIFLFSRGWFFNFVCLEGEEKKNRGISKNQYLKYLFFSVPSSCDVCAGVITHSAGYVWFSIQFRLSKTSGVFAFPPPPSYPFDDLWARLLFTYSFQFFKTTTKTNTWMHSVQGLKHFFDLCYKVKSLDFWFVNNIWSS